MRGTLKAASTKCLLLLFGLLTSLSLQSWVFSPISSAADTNTPNDFSLQVSPSPLVATLKPGSDTSLDLQIRNTGSSAQNLKMGLRTFSIDATTGKVDLQKQEPADIKQFVSFAAPTFSVQPGQIFSQHVNISLPASAGFSYSFAIVINQVNPPKAANGTTAIQGSVAVFTLLSVDRPGAVAKLELSSLTASKKVYEYLPASLDLKLKNSGNTLIQPKGTLFIQRHSNDATPITSIPFNKAGGYILPNSSRSLQTDWNDGYPHYVTDANQQKHLSWSGGDISKLRFGHYVAKVVAVYDNNGHDESLIAEVSFWVIPWRALFIALFIVALLAVGLITTFRKSTTALQPGIRKVSSRGKPKT